MMAFIQSKTLKLYWKNFETCQ